MRLGKNWLRVGFVVLTVAILLFAIRFVRATSLFKTIEEVEASCRTIEAVAGPEDIVIDRARGLAFVSATDRRVLRAGGAESASLRGGIYKIDLNQPVDRWTLVPVTPSRPESFRPHGLGLFISEEGIRSLFVVNHPAGGSDEVVVFNVDPQGRLSQRLTVSDPLMIHLNDVAPVGAESFYATNDHGPGTSSALQDILMLELTKILNLGTGPDNIDVLENGDLLIGAHPKILDLASHAEDPEALSPSQVVRVSRDDAGDWSVRTLYLDRGDEVSGVAVAAGYRDLMLLGPVFQPQIMACARTSAL